jgi:integrase
MAIDTGLRVSELKSITLADTHLDATPPYLMLRAENEKARRGARQPLGDDLAVVIREYLDARLRHEQCLARQDDAPVPMALPLDAPLVPGTTLRAFDKDLEAAGITKKDEWGRTVDLHCLRHTFGTLLAQSGVAPRTAQELMRHSDIRLTTNIYQHLALADTAPAVNRLPSIPLSEPPARAAAT